jgi:hypothetical protein
VEAYRAALKERKRERGALDWAGTQNNLGIALMRIGERTRDLAPLREAREAIAGAFAVYMEAGQEHRRPQLEAELRDIDRAIAELGGGASGGDGGG